MKNNTSFATLTILGLAILVTLGCQVVSQAVSTPEGDPGLAPELASSPTEILPPTQNPEQDISSAVIMLEDLPPGFERFTPEELGLSVDDFAEDEFQPEEVFMFINSQDFQMIFGFNFLLSNMLERAAFDVGISQPEITLPALINGIGSENVQDEKLLEGFDDVGEAQIGMTMVANMEGVPVQVDVLMFRRDVIGAMVMSMVLEGQTPNISIHNLGLKFDSRIQDTLKTMK